MVPFYTVSLQDSPELHPNGGELLDGEQEAIQNTSPSAGNHCRRARESDDRPGGGLAEKQLAEGTASSAVITHYLKLGTTRERLEKEKLAKENELLKAKTEALASSARVEELYKQALDAMRSYGSSRSDKEL